MKKLPIYYGYAGTLPFFFFMLLSLVADKQDSHIVTFLQMSYGAMILSFLGGIHWGQAIPTSNNKQLGFAMVPTIASLFLMVWVFLIDPYLPLLLMVALFWVVYYADKKLMPLEYISEGYFDYRRHLTIIVSVTLIISFFALI